MTAIEAFVASVVEQASRDCPPRWSGRSAELQVGFHDLLLVRAKADEAGLTVLAQGRYSARVRTVHESILVTLYAPDVHVIAGVVDAALACSPDGTLDRDLLERCIPAVVSSLLDGPLGSIPPASCTAQIAATLLADDLGGPLPMRSVRDRALIVVDSLALESSCLVSAQALQSR